MPTIFAVDLELLPQDRQDLQICNPADVWEGVPLGPLRLHDSWKATKEYLNHMGTKIRVFRVCFQAPFLPPIFPHSSPLFPLQALSPLLLLFPSSPPPLHPLLSLPENSDLGTPMI